MVETETMSILDLQFDEARKRASMPMPKSMLAKV
jgi:hypothetical protein